MNKTFYSDVCLDRNVSRTLTNGGDQARNRKFSGFNVRRKAVLPQSRGSNWTDRGQLNVLYGWIFFAYETEEVPDGRGACKSNDMGTAPGIIHRSAKSGS